MMHPTSYIYQQFKLNSLKIFLDPALFYAGIGRLLKRK